MTSQSKWQLFAAGEPTKEALRKLLPAVLWHTGNSGEIYATVQGDMGQLIATLKVASCHAAVVLAQPAQQAAPQGEEQALVLTSAGGNAFITPFSLKWDWASNSWKEG